MADCVALHTAFGSSSTSRIHGRLEYSVLEDCVATGDARVRMHMRMRAAAPAARAPHGLDLDLVRALGRGWRVRRAVA